MATIAETAVGNENFSTLVTALKAAGLVDVFAGSDEYTVFAPTNEAFAKVPAEALQALLADADKLGAVLKYHVVPGKVTAEEVMEMDEATTLEGDVLTITVGEDDSVMINDAKVVMADVECDNGVIHAIDTVLMPPMDDMMEEAGEKMM